MAESEHDILRAQHEEEVARLEKQQIAQQKVERLRFIAGGEADAMLARYQAEADGLRKVLEAKAAGYERLMAVCGDRKDLAPALLIVEQLPSLVAEQVKAIQNLQNDKITACDSANGTQGSSTAGFLRGLIGSLPPLHDLAKQAGIELPEVLGEISDTRDMETSETANDGSDGATEDNDPEAKPAP